MFDPLAEGAVLTCRVGGIELEVTTAVREHTRLRVMWVRGLHWPGCCECDGEHVPIGFGEGIFGGTFLLSHRYFWEKLDLGINLELLELDFKAWLGQGELPDWAAAATAADS